MLRVWNDYESVSVDHELSAKSSVDAGDIFAILKLVIFFVVGDRTSDMRRDRAG